MMQRIYPQDRLETDSDQESYRSLAYDATNEQTRFNSATVGISAPSSWAPERPWAPAIKRLPTPFLLPRLETDSDQESYRSLAYDAANEQTRFNSATVGISAPSSWAPERPWAPAIKRLPTPFLLPLFFSSS